MTVSKPDALYAAFDLYPSAKGAATHIYYMFSSIRECYNNPMLFVLGNDYLPYFQQENNFCIKRHVFASGNLLERAMSYTEALSNELKRIGKGLQIAHFRDIWSGMAILNHENRKFNTVFEVNSLPTIELPYRYPMLLPKTLEKIKNLETFCLKNSDQIIVPSNVIKENLLARGISEPKIHVITNGADLPEKYEKPIDAPKKYLIYFGALQRWQGVDVLLKAFSLLRDKADLHLVIASSNKKKYAKALAKYADKLEITERILWLYELPREELFAYLQHAIMSIVPLKEDERNTAQGASPIKIFESMANNCPVVASDLPIVREIFSNQPEAVSLVRPDRPAELSRTIRFLLEFPEKLETRKANAYKLFQSNYQWNTKKEQVISVYQAASENNN